LQEVPRYDKVAGCGRGNGCADSGAPTKLESTSSALDANDEARPIVPLGSFASTAPGKLESISSALDANEAGQPIISQRVMQPTTTIIPSNDTYENRDMDPYDVQSDAGRCLAINQTEDCASARDDIEHGIIDNVTDDVYSKSDNESGIENALPCVKVDQTKEVVPKKKWSAKSLGPSPMLISKR
jgi:hypothetical protein